MQNKFIFLHILKTGGLSLRHMLLEQFGYDAETERNWKRKQVKHLKNGEI